MPNAGFSTGVRHPDEHAVIRHNLGMDLGRMRRPFCKNTAMRIEDLYGIYCGDIYIHIHYIYIYIIYIYIIYIYMYIHYIYIYMYIHYIYIYMYIYIYIIYIYIYRYRYI